jgi:hypothetical protein
VPGIKPWKAAAAGQSMQAYLLAELTRLAERPSMAEITQRAQPGPGPPDRPRPCRTSSRRCGLRGTGRNHERLRPRRLRGGGGADRGGQPRRRTAVRSGRGLPSRSSSSKRRARALASRRRGGCPGRARAVLSISPGDVVPVAQSSLSGVRGNLARSGPAPVGAPALPGRARAPLCRLAAVDQVEPAVVDGERGVHGRGDPGDQGFRAPGLAVGGGDVAQVRVGAVAAVGQVQGVVEDG